MIFGVTSDLVTNEAFVVLHMFSSLNEGEVNSIDVHGIGVSQCPRKKGSDTTSSLEAHNPFLLGMEFACLFYPFI